MPKKKLGGLALFAARAVPYHARHAPHSGMRKRTLMSHVPDVPDLNGALPIQHLKP